MTNFSTRTEVWEKEMTAPEALVPILELLGQPTTRTLSLTIEVDEDGLVECATDTLMLVQGAATPDEIRAQGREGFTGDENDDEQVQAHLDAVFPRMALPYEQVADVLSNDGGFVLVGQHVSAMVSLTGQGGL